MANPSGARRRLVPSAAIGVAVVAMLVGAVFATRDTNSAPVAQTDATATSTALAIAQTLRNDAQLALAVASLDGVTMVVQRTASLATTNAVDYAMITIQRASPQLTGLYLYDRTGSFVTSQIVNQSHRPLGGLSVYCDTTNTYCTENNVPASGYLSSTLLRASLARALAQQGELAQTLSFACSGGPYGCLYTVAPIRASHGNSVLGVLVAQVDAANIFTPYLQRKNGGNVMIVSGGAVIDGSLPSFRARGELPVLHTDAGLEAGIAPGLHQIPAGFSLAGAHPRFTYHGLAVMSSLAPVPAAHLVVVSYVANVAGTSNVWRDLVALILGLLLAGIGLATYGGYRRRHQAAPSVLRPAATGAPRRQPLSMPVDQTATSMGVEQPSAGMPYPPSRTPQPEVPRSRYSLPGPVLHQARLPGPVADPGHLPSDTKPGQPRSESDPPEPSPRVAE